MAPVSEMKNANYSNELLAQWHKTSQQLLAQQMFANQMKNTDYYESGNIHQLPTKYSEQFQNVQRHGKGLVSEIGGAEPWVENLPQMEPKLMQSAISASNRQTIPWQGGKQYLDQKIQKHGKDPEI